MTLDPSCFQRLLGELGLDRLFNELGWDHPGLGPEGIEANGESLTLTPIAQKRGVLVFRCSPDAVGDIPLRPPMLRIEKEAAKLAHEHLPIFADAGETTLTWLCFSSLRTAPDANADGGWRTRGPML